MGKTHVPRDVEAAGRREKAARAAELGDVREVMGSVRGRAWVWRVLERTGVELGIFYSPNAMDLANRVGVQSVGHAMLAEIRLAAPETELLMRREAADRAARALLQEDVKDDNQ